MKIARDFRERARQSLSGRWGSAVLTTLLASILGADITMGIGSNASSITSSINNTVNNGSGDTSYSDLLASVPITTLTYVFGALVAIAGLVFIIGIVQYVIGSFVSLGLIQYNLDLIDGRDVELGQIFSKAPMFGKAFWLRLRMSIFTALWTLLFIIPGIIKVYAYSMSGFILTENPEMTAKEAMNVSQKMMKGNKWRLFCLELSFIGWKILGVLSLGIGMLWVTPYYNAAIAAFYDEISREPLD